MKIPKLSACLLAAVCLLAACADPPPPPVLHEAVRVTYDSAMVTKGDLRRTTYYEAYVRAEVETLSFEKSNGSFGEYRVFVGDSVKAGDVLAVMDTTAFDEAIAAATAALAAREERLAYDRKMKQIDIELAKLDVLDAVDETALSLANVEVRRQEAALRQLEALASLELSSYTSRLETAQAALEGTVITAPFDGDVVALAGKRAGQRVSSNDMILRLSNPQSLYVQFDGTDNIATTRGSFSAQIGAAEYPLEPVAYEQSEYVSLVLAGKRPAPMFRFAETPASVRAGDFAALLQVESEATDTLMIPVNALYTANGQNYVYRIMNGEKIYTEIKIGIRNAAFAAVTEGLEEGDEVFVKQ